jgi:outer membrane protein
MRNRTSRARAAGLLLALAAAVAQPLWAEDLLQVYREAREHDPTLAAAQANWQATQERLPQARALLLPNVNLNGALNATMYDATVHTNPRVDVNGRGFAEGSLTVQASQPLYRYANKVGLDQARDQVEQSDFSLESVRQDLILRVAQAYFDVLLAQFNVELAESQKAAVSEQLAQARRNFEVGVATITDTNEAQARYDAIVAQQIAAANDLENKRAALRAIIGRAPADLKRLGPGFEPQPPSPNSADAWIDRALANNIQVRIAQYNYDIATLEVERQRAAHLPTLDLVGSYGLQAASGSTQLGAANYARQAVVGLAVTVPLYEGGFIDSKVREAIALQDTARQNLEAARRNALFGAQTGYAGVTSAAASVKAFEQALVSAQTAYESNRTGQEVGVRTNLDVLNTRQQVYQTRRDLAQAYFNYLMGVLRLKSAVGTLDEADLADVNRRLQG